MIAEKASVTAKMCAFARAYHATMARQKIFDDYLAYDMMGKDDYDKVAHLVRRYISGKPRYGFESNLVFEVLDRFFSPVVLSRLAFAETELIKFAERKKECQYVICGAGLDTFAFRNTNPHIHVFELDHPDTQAHKLERIHTLRWTVPDNVEYAPIDFAKDSLPRVLLRAGFQPDIPTFFSILGVVYYLSAETFEGLFEDIGMVSLSETQAAFDYSDDGIRQEHAECVQDIRKLTASVGEPMNTGFSLEEVYASLAKQKFHIKKHEMPADIQQEFFVRRPDGQHAAENIHFVLAQKSAKGGIYIGKRDFH